eukprot:283165_1
MSSSKCYFSTLHPEWVPLPKLSKENSHGVVSQTNSCSFISMIKSNNNYENARMRQYNVHKNEWELYHPYPSKFHSSKHNLIFNKSDKQLYLYGKIPQITIINTSNGSFNTINSNNIIGIHYPCLVNVNNIIHIIGGKGNCSHLIYNNKSQLLQKSNALNWPNLSFDIQHSTSIYIPSKQAILLIGGYGSNSESIGIWKYSLQTRFWTILRKGNEFNICGCSAVLTANEKHIIIMNGYYINFETNPPHKPLNNIFIIDIPNDGDDNKYLLYKIKNTQLKTPITGRHYIIKTGGNIFEDKLIVFGYIRICMKLKEMKHIILPQYIQKLIVEYCKLKEMIHWLEKDSFDQTNKHFSILVDDILMYHPKYYCKKMDIVKDKSLQITNNVLNILSFLLLVPRPWQN